MLSVCKAVFFEKVVDAGKKDAVGIDERVAIAENLLELLDGTKRAPNACREADKTDRRFSKLSGNFSMSMKYLSMPGTLPLYSGVTTMRPSAFRTASAKGWKDCGFSA